MKTNRSCERDGVNCTLCCTTHAVRQIYKDPHVACKHCMQEGGCTIYADKPTACTDFTCAYLEGDVPESEWPYACGFVQERINTSFSARTWVFAALSADQLKTPAAMHAIRRALMDDWVVVLDAPRKFTVVYPDNHRPTMLALSLALNGGEVKYAHEIFGEALLARRATRKCETVFELL